MNLINNSQTYSQGRIASLKDGVARCEGLAGVMYGEMVSAGNITGVVIELNEEYVVVALLGEDSCLKTGDIVVGSGKLLQVPVGPNLLGRIVDPLGRPIDGCGEIQTSISYNIESPAPKIMDRLTINQSLHTGIKAIDSYIPIGKGQRELILGDRGTGKTQIALDTIVTQASLGTKCIYVAIGKTQSVVKGIINYLEQKSVLQNIIVVFASSNNAALQTIAPFAGCAMGEYFRDRGEDALVVYDDLSKHAWAHRQTSLLLGCNPGREAYPGDMFYVHARLLERAANVNSIFIKAKSGLDKQSGSLTALPIIETLGGDISSFISTNVISITDGQIILSSELFSSGILPAIDPSLSVSRVGKLAQTKLIRQLSGNVRLYMAQYRELESFASISSDLDAETKKTLDRGLRTIQLFKQKSGHTVNLPELAVSLTLIQEDLLADIDWARLSLCEQFIQNQIKNDHEALYRELESGKPLDTVQLEAFKTLLISIKETYKLTCPNY